MVKARRHFTLTEFLLVTAVLAVLISMLMPALKSSMEHARVLQCSQNLRGNQMLLSLYLDDHGSRIHCRPIGNLGSSSSFYNYYHPYTDKSYFRFADITTGHLTCPSTPPNFASNKTKAYNEGAGWSHYFASHGQYYFNGLATKMPYKKPEQLGNRPVSIIKSPEAFVTWHEGHTPSYGAGPYDDFQERPSAYPGSPYSTLGNYLWAVRWAHHARPYEPHTSVMSFLDGRAIAIEYETYKELAKQNEIVWAVNR